MTPNVLRAKLDRFVAPRMLREGIGQWVVLTREGSRDPVAAHLGGESAVGRMALVIRLSGSSLELDAVCASYDVSPLADSGLYSEILSYGQEGWTRALDTVLSRAEGLIAVDCSADEPHADGLSHTLRGELLAGLGDGAGSRLISSEPLVVELLGRKIEEEIEGIRRAAIEAEEILRRALTGGSVVPGRTRERELAEEILAEVERRGHGLAWEPPFCPSVQFGTTRGHAAPGDRTAAEGEIVAVDFGVEIDGFCSDLQRTLVMTRPDRIPEEIATLWRVTRESVDAAAAGLRPGVTGLSVDEAARSIVREAGYVDYVHATGHPLGYDVHDVGPMLGPDWPGRYGGRVHAAIDEGMVFTLEPAAAIESAGGLIRIGLEEDVVVRSDGVEFLAPRQTELWTLPDR